MTGKDSPASLPKDSPSLRERASDWAYAAGWALVKAIPEWLARKLFDLGADIAWRREGPGVAQLRKNLARVLSVDPAAVPPQLLRASLRSYARYWRESFRLPSMDHRALGAGLGEKIHGVEQIEKSMAAGRGVILALPHSGNWDVAGLYVVAKYGTFSTVAERLKPESLFLRFVEYREGLGFSIIPLSGGAQPPTAPLLERLASGGIVCLMADRDLTASGQPVTFFSEETLMPAGSVRLAQLSGAALLPVHCWYTDDGWEMLVEPPLDVDRPIGEAVQALADRFAANITDHPADWHMLQAFWPSDLSDSRRKRLERAIARRHEAAQRDLPQQDLSQPDPPEPA